MAFETIVKRQIEQFKTPSVKCVDMVVDELSKVVHKCTGKVTYSSDLILVGALHLSFTDLVNRLNLIVYSCCGNPSHSCHT